MRLARSGLTVREHSSVEAFEKVPQDGAARLPINFFLSSFSFIKMIQRATVLQVEPAPVDM